MMALSRWFTAWRTRPRPLFRRGRLEGELDAELQFHLDQQVAVVSFVAAAACHVPSRRLLAGNPVAAVRHD